MYSMWRSWNVAADDEYLWQLQYTTFFGCSDDNSKPINDKDSVDDFATAPHVDWKEEFKRAYVGENWDGLQILNNIYTHLWFG